MKEKKYKEEIKEDESEKCDDKTIDYFFLILHTIIDGTLYFLNNFGV